MSASSKHCHPFSVAVGPILTVVTRSQKRHVVTLSSL